MRLRNIPGARDAIAASPWVIQKPEEHCGSWKEVFGNSGPLHLEIGTGKGRFIMQLAQEHPEINYIGIEKYSSVLLRCLEKQEELQLQNLFFIRSTFPIPGPRKDMPDAASPPPNISEGMTRFWLREVSSNSKQITGASLTSQWKKLRRAHLKSPRLPMTSIMILP